MANSLAAWGNLNLEINLIAMRAKPQLTHNAILYCSVGFKQECLLQVLSIHPQPPSALEMVVYDGTVYAGASYLLPHVLPPHPDPKAQNRLAPPRPLPQNPLEAYQVLPGKCSHSKTTRSDQSQTIPRKQPRTTVPLSIRRVAEDLTIVEKGITEMLGK